MKKEKKDMGLKWSFSISNDCQKDIWKKKNIKLKEIEIIDHYPRNG